MPRAAGCERCAKCSPIGSAYMEVKETGRKGVGDSQCNKNEEKLRSEDTVGQNASTVHQVFYVA